MTQANLGTLFGLAPRTISLVSEASDAETANNLGQFQTMAMDQTAVWRAHGTPLFQVTPIPTSTNKSRPRKSFRDWSRPTFTFRTSGNNARSKDSERLPKVSKLPPDRGSAHRGDGWLKKGEDHSVFNVQPQ